MRRINDDPVERIIEDFLIETGVSYIKDQRHPYADRTLDFYLPTYDLFIEVKQFHTERAVKQLAGLTNVLLVQGIPAARALVKLLLA